MFPQIQPATGKQALLILEYLKNRLSGLPDTCIKTILPDLQKISHYIDSQAVGTNGCQPDSASEGEPFRVVNRKILSILFRWDLQAGQVELSGDVRQVFGDGPDQSQSPVEREWWDKRIHPDDRQRVSMEIGAALDGSEGEYRVEYRARHHDGHWVSLREQAFIQRDANGKAIQVQGTAIDFTRETRAEQKLLIVNKALAGSNIALRKSQELFRVALANAPVAMFLTDLDLRYTWFYSPGLGIPGEKLVGKRDDEILPKDSVAQFLDIKWTALNKKQVVRRELSLNFGDQQRILIVSVEPFYSSQNQLSGVIGSCLDVTEQRRLEAREVENIFKLEVDRRLLDCREKERQQLARHIHDGPIQSLSGLGFNIQLAREISTDSEVSGVLDQMGDGVRGLVGDLRQMTNELHPTGLIRFGLTSAIRASSVDFQKRHPNIKVKLALMRDVNRAPENVQVALFRILQESLANITQHAQASEVTISLSINQGQVMMEIKDNGQGFDLPRAWVEFTRQGCYGLVLMKERAESVGGELKLRTSHGEGTAVQVNIQRIEQPIALAV